MLDCIVDIYNKALKIPMHFTLFILLYAPEVSSLYSQNKTYLSGQCSDL